MDLNGDQLPEIVFSDQFEDDILVLQNQDNLSFSAPSFISGEEDGGNNLKIVDLEGDNDLDIVALQSFDTNFAGGLRF